MILNLNFILLKLKYIKFNWINSSKKFNLIIIFKNIINFIIV